MRCQLEVRTKERKREYRKVDITEFGLTLLLLYINSSKARKISAEILLNIRHAHHYRFERNLIRERSSDNNIGYEGFKKR